MALTYALKGEMHASQTAGATEAGAASLASGKLKKGQVKRLPLDGVRFDLPMRLRTGHMLALFGVSAAQFYKLRKVGKIPEPAGHIGTGKRPAPYWITTEILPFI